MSRKERGLNQNLYLIETIPTDNPYHKKFAVMGTTGNVYDVSIKEKLECTCPDYNKRGKNCKHIYFVLLKVMKVNGQARNNFSQKDLEEMFKNIPEVTSNLIVNPEIRSLYKQKTEGVQTEKLETDENGKVKRQPTNDICPICLDNLEEGSQDDLDYCKYGCGKSIHKNCFSMWCKKNQRTCVFCRAKWDKEGEKKNNIDENKYINLTGNQGKRPKYDGVKRSSGGDYYFDKRKYRKNLYRARAWYDFSDESGEDKEESEEESHDWSMASYNNNNSFLNSENSNINNSSNSLSSFNKIKSSLDFLKESVDGVDGADFQTEINQGHLGQSNNFSKEDFKSGFQVFFKLERENYSAEEIDSKEILKIISAVWKELPQSEKDSYDLIAKYGREDNRIWHPVDPVENGNIKNKSELSEEEKEVDYGQYDQIPKSQISSNGIRRQENKNKNKVIYEENSYEEDSSDSDSDDREINKIKNKKNLKNITGVSKINSITNTNKQSKSISSLNKSEPKSKSKTKSENGKAKQAKTKKENKKTNRKSRSRSRSSLKTVKSTKSTRSNTSLKNDPHKNKQKEISKRRNTDTNNSSIIMKPETARKSTGLIIKSYGKTQHVTNKDKNDKRRKNGKNEISRNESDSE
jgi:hypothetical protein